MNATWLRSVASTVAALGFGSVGVYLAARHFGPIASAVVSCLGMGGVSFAYARRVARLGRALERQTHLARVNDLTGLANDRSFREALRAVESQSTGAALALIDVNRFKAYNDAFGHRAGDAALRDIGQILAGFASGSTRVYRVGGDEFAVIVTDFRASPPAEALEAIRRGVADHPWPLRPITVSIGLDSIEGASAEPLFERADRSLYRAKQIGGNRVIAQGVEENAPP